MREDNATPKPEKRDSGPPGAENAPARKPIKEHPRGMRFDDHDLQAISHIMDQFPHLKNQNDAIRFAVKHLALQVLPKPIRFRTLDPEELFEVQRLVDDCLQMHKQNRLNLFKLRPKTAELKAREIKALQAIEKETVTLEKISRLISKQCILSSELTSSDAENIKSFIGMIDSTIKTSKGTDKQIYIPRYELVKKVLNIFLYK
jgi:hypothetical protein